MQKTIRIQLMTIASMVIAALLSFPDAPAHAAHKHGTLGEVEVHVRDNKRTKRSYVVSLVHRCLEKDPPKAWDTLDTETLRQCIYDSRLFSKVEVTAERPLITVQVKERWTLIPIPNIRASSEEYTVGGFLLESNFLGRGKLLVIGGSYGSEGTSYMLLLNDPSVLFTDWKLGLRLFKGRMEQYAYDGEDKLYGTEVDYETAGLQIGYRLTPKIELDTGAYRTRRTYSSLDSDPEPDDLSHTSYELRAEYKDADYRLYFNQGLFVRGKYMINTDKSDGSSSSKEGEALVRYEHNPVADHALRLRARWRGTDSDDIRMTIVEGGRRGLRGVHSRGLWYKEGTFLSLDYNVPILKRGYGTWTVGTFVDHARYKPFFDDSGTEFTAYGVGVYLYLNTVALPGISVEAGQNERFMGDFVSFSVGMQM